MDTTILTVDTSVHPNVTTPDSSTPEGRVQNVLIGCLLAICGNLVISISLNLQKYTHMVLANTTAHYAHRPVWWLGVILMGVGELGNFSAYGFAPASLVAPLGTTTVIANIFIAGIFLKEKIAPPHIFGSTLAIVGAILLVTSSNGKEKVLGGKEIQSYLGHPVLIAYLCIEVVVLAVLFFFLYVRRLKLVVIYLLITSLLASFTVISAKGVSGMLQLSIAGWSQFHYPIFYIMLIVMIATAIIQVKYLNEAMQGYDATIVVPTNFVFFTISAILGGVIFYEEFNSLSATSIFVFLLGCVLCFVGVYFITARLGESQPITNDDTEACKPIIARSGSHISNIIPTWLTASLSYTPVQPGDNPVTLPSDASPQRGRRRDEDSSDEETYARNAPSSKVTQHEESDMSHLLTNTRQSENIGHMATTRNTPADYGSANT